MNAHLSSVGRGFAVRFVQLLLGCGLVLSPMSGAAAAPRAQLPGEVTAFRVQRDQCDHFRSEDPGADEARARQLERSLARTCTGTDARLRALRVRYAHAPAVLAALSRYEAEVE